MQAPVSFYLDEFVRHSSDNKKRKNNFVIYNCQMNAYDVNDLIRVREIVHELGHGEKSYIKKTIGALRPKLEYHRYHIAPYRENGRGWRKLAQKVSRDLIKVSYNHVQNGFEMPAIYPCYQIGKYIIENLENKRNNVMAGEVVRNIKRLDRTHKSGELSVDFYIKEMVGEEAKQKNRDLMNGLFRDISNMNGDKKLRLESEPMEIVEKVIENWNKMSLEVSLDQFEKIRLQAISPQTF